MSALFEVRLNALPECWDSCGNCRADEFEVVELLVAVGDSVTRYDPLLSWEADKAAFELSAPRTGRIAGIFIEVGDRFYQDEILMLIETDGA